ncbi:MAG TPA: SPFH domain-containing protein [Candidatus Polarisedimenticolaceae bacterium]|nr:SPFH domain-containing protein [Candidatus Polarisedimenticolaceae bacterium]
MPQLGTLMTVLVFVVVPIVFFILILAVAKRYKKVGPNQAMVISGRKHRMRLEDGSTDLTGYRIRKGGGAFIFPLLERVDILSLEVMTLDITTPEVYTKPGVPIVVDGVAQVKIRGDEGSIRTAAEQFLGKTVDQIKEVALQTVEGHLRAIIGTLSVEEIYRNRDQFAGSVQEVAVSDLANMGLVIVSFTLKDIRDSHGYLDALGKPRTAEVKRDAVIAQAEADRDASIKSAQARQAGEIVKFEAETRIAEANRDFQSKKAEYDAAVNLKRAEADLAYDIQRNRTSQLLKKEEVQIAVVEKEQQIAVQEREIQRREKELEATVKRQADAERYRVETEAAAQRAKSEQVARGEAEARRQKGLADADVIKATGTSEADIIALKGTAEAEAMRKKADSFKEYNQAAVLQILLAALPEIAKAVAEPLSKTDRITLVSTGGDGTGASRLTGDIAKIMAELPAVVESLSGVDIRRLIEQIPALRGALEERKKGEGPKPA